jgi:hypothetical protein
MGVWQRGRLRLPVKQFPLGHGGSNPSAPTSHDLEVWPNGKAAALKADGPHASAVSGFEPPRLLHKRVHRKSAGAVQRRCLESRWSVMNRHPGSNPGSSASAFFGCVRERPKRAAC